MARPAAPKHKGARYVADVAAAADVVASGEGAAMGWWSACIRAFCPMKR